MEYFRFFLVAACRSFIVVVVNGAVCVPVFGVNEGLWLASSMATCVVASLAAETDETELMPVLWVRGSEYFGVACDFLGLPRCRTCTRVSRCRCWWWPCRGALVELAWCGGSLRLWICDTRARKRTKEQGG